MIMRSETIFNRDNGKRVKVTVLIGGGNNFFQTEVSCCEKNKRTWIDVTKDDRTFRMRTELDQIKVLLRDKLAVVSEQELLTAKIEAWNKLKPS